MPRHLQHNRSKSIICPGTILPWLQFQHFIHRNGGNLVAKTLLIATKFVKILLSPVLRCGLCWEHFLRLLVGSGGKHPSHTRSLSFSSISAHHLSAPRRPAPVPMILVFYLFPIVVIVDTSWACGAKPHPLNFGHLTGLLPYC